MDDLKRSSPIRGAFYAISTETDVMFIKIKNDYERKFDD
jgi:hypothetical protein